MRIMIITLSVFFCRKTLLKYYLAFLVISSFCSNLRCCSFAPFCFQPIPTNWINSSSWLNLTMNEVLCLICRTCEQSTTCCAQTTDRRRQSSVFRWIQWTKWQVLVPRSACAAVSRVRACANVSSRLRATDRWRRAHTASAVKTNVLSPQLKRD